MDTLNEYKKYLILGFLLLVVILSALFMLRFFSELRNYGNSGSRDVSVISLSGHGEVQAVPDIANVYFSISKDAKTAKEAQGMVAKIEKASLAFLKGSGVLDKDIKASNASFSPKYEYKYDTKIMPPCASFYCPPQNGHQVIVGYTASESITVKIRSVDDVGKIMEGLGGLNVSNLSGPNFAIDNEDSLKAEARQKAIVEAKAKAEILAKDLGVSLVKITGFSESGNYSYPMMYGKSVMMDSVASAPLPAVVPKGENTISSDVTITYEIR